jgi:hypothetical protein
VPSIICILLVFIILSVLGAIDPLDYLIITKFLFE